MTLDESSTRRERTLDTSEILRTENYRGIVREVALGKSQPFNSFQETLEHAVQQGYHPYNLSIVNVTRGEPAKNEPRAVLLLLKEGITTDLNVDHCVGGGLIAKEGKKFCFYELGKDFSFVA